MSEDALQTEPRLGQALRVLMEYTEANPAAGGGLSASQWAEAAGFVASELAPTIRQLQELGAEIEGSEAAGYRLRSLPDVALPELLEPKIAGTIFSGGVHHFAWVGSTNALAMRGGSEGARHGEVWLADEQRAGKGRAGHVWQSDPRDGVYCSALLRPKLSPYEVIILSLAAGLAVVEAVHEVTGLWGDLRWPNDVLLGDRKFCGILTELNAEVTRVRYVVVGVGVNVNQGGFPAELASIATSLRIESGRNFRRIDLVAALLRALDREVRELEQGARVARERILRRFEEHSTYCCGTAVTVEEDGGYEGVTRGLDERGFLLVESQEGVRTVLSGGVRKR